MDHAIIAFDGLSLAGKSTLSQMLLERSKNAVVIRENSYDPLRPATSKLNKHYKSSLKWHEGLDRLASEYADNELVLDTVKQAKSYVESLDMYGPHPDKNCQAALAYFFAAGRKIVNDELKRQLEEHDVILDRWLASGWAYQVQPQVGDSEPYTWQQIKELNDSMDILYPNRQIIVTCRVDQIPMRRAYRQKEGVGTAGQMSFGREEIIYNAFREIHVWMSLHGIPSTLIENNGTPAEYLQDQVGQAILTYLQLEDVLRSDIEGHVVGGFDSYDMPS